MEHSRIETDDAAVVGASAVRKASRRLVPFLIVLYIVAWLDRVNVGFAALQMNRDLGFSAATYGFGAQCVALLDDEAARLFAI